MHGTSEFSKYKWVLLCGSSRDTCLCSPMIRAEPSASRAAGSLFHRVLRSTAFCGRLLLGAWFRGIFGRDADDGSPALVIITVMFSPSSPKAFSYRLVIVRYYSAIPSNRNAYRRAYPLEAVVECCGGGIVTRAWDWTAQIP